MSLLHVAFVGLFPSQVTAHDVRPPQRACHARVASRLAGISSAIHPCNSFAPTKHFTYRYFDTIVPAYAPLLEKRKGTPYTQAEKAWQQLRRGRYVEAWQHLTRALYVEVAANQEQESLESRAFADFLQRLQLAINTKKRSEKASHLLPSDMTLLEPVADYGVGVDAKPGSKAAATKILQGLKRSATIIAAHQLLVELGIWSRHDNLALRRSKFLFAFSESCLEAARNVTATVPDISRERLDLSHLKVYTIDDESTMEIDDGLSAERTDDGRWKYWVHIADASRWVVPGDVLEMEARRRSTSMYLPTETVYMFPALLATGAMSLVQGSSCCALSFCFELDEKGAISTYSIHPTTITPTYRLSYDDVEEEILGHDEEPELQALYEASLKRSKWRESQGSISINLPDAVIKVVAVAESGEDGLGEGEGQGDGQGEGSEERVMLNILNSSSPARQLVAEMMIACGEIAGRVGQDNNIPLPYRGQPQPDLPSDDELQEFDGVVRECIVRRCMQRSTLDTRPTRHASLGLDAYVQVTSPIRRYTDLLAHFQLKAFLQNDQLPYTEENLSEVLDASSSVSAEANSVERSMSRYWLLEYLRRRSQKQSEWRGVITRCLRDDGSLALVMLDDIGSELVVRSYRELNRGDQVVVRIDRVDPKLDQISLSDITAKVMKASL